MFEIKKENKQTYKQKSESFQYYSSNSSYFLLGKNPSRPTGI